MVAVKPSFSRFLRSDVERHAYERQENLGTPVVLPTTSKPDNVRLDFSKIENLVDQGDRWIARCPACAESGRDKTGNHLVIFPTGQYGCVLFDRDDGIEHRKEIWELIGIKGKYKQVVSEEIIAAQKAERERIAKVKEIYQGVFETMLEHFSGGVETIDGSADLPDTARGHFQVFSRLWKPSEIAWVGNRYDHQAAFKSHLFELSNDWERAWEMVESQGLDHTSGLTWDSSATARSPKKFGRKRKFLVVEHDGLAINQQVGLIAGLMQSKRFGLNLLAIIETGGKGVHAWFDGSQINAMTYNSLRDFLKAVGGDSPVFSWSSTRTPGAIRQPTENNAGGALQKFCWISPAIVKGETL
jgi:hypothetical protein